MASLTKFTVPEGEILRQAHLVLKGRSLNKPITFCLIPTCSLT